MKLEIEKEKQNEELIRNFQLTKYKFLFLYTRFFVFSTIYVLLNNKTIMVARVSRN